jgi:hypothetical protein
MTEPEIIKRQGHTWIPLPMAETATQTTIEVWLPAERMNGIHLPPGEQHDQPGPHPIPALIRFTGAEAHREPRHDPALDSPAASWRAIVLCAYERKPFDVAGVRYEAVPPGLAGLEDPRIRAVRQYAEDRLRHLGREVTSIRIGSDLLGLLGENTDGAGVRRVTAQPAAPRASSPRLGTPPAGEPRALLAEARTWTTGRFANAEPVVAELIQKLADALQVALYDAPAEDDAEVDAIVSEVAESRTAPEVGVVQRDMISAVTTLGFDPHDITRIEIDGEQRTVVVTTRQRDAAVPTSLVEKYPWIGPRLDPEAPAEGEDG